MRDALDPGPGDDAARFARKAKKVQDVLGEHQDAVVAEAWLREHRTTAPFVAGELVAIERAAARSSRDEWPEVWDAARAKKLRTWM